MKIIWTYFLLGALGLLVQTCIKIAVLKTQSKAANHPFSFKEYFINDWPTILGSILTVVIAVLTLDEWLPINTLVSKYVKVFFVFVGFTGSSLIQAVFSFYSRKLTSIIDIKTNIADGVNPPINISNIEGVKSIIEDNKTI